MSTRVSKQNRPQEKRMASSQRRPTCLAAKAQVPANPKTRSDLVEHIVGVLKYEYVQSTQIAALPHHRSCAEQKFTDYSSAAVDTTVLYYSVCPLKLPIIKHYLYRRLSVEAQAMMQCNVGNRRAIAPHRACCWHFVLSGTLSAHPVHCCNRGTARKHGCRSLHKAGHVHAYLVPYYDIISYLAASPDRQHPQHTAPAAGLQ